MKRFSEIDEINQIKIINATSLLGMLKRAKKMECELSADDVLYYSNINIFNSKKVTPIHLLKARDQKLIKDYNITFNQYGTHKTLEIEFNNGTSLICNSEIVFKL